MEKIVLGAKIGSAYPSIDQERDPCPGTSNSFSLWGKAVLDAEMSIRGYANELQGYVNELQGYANELRVFLTLWWRYSLCWYGQISAWGHWTSDRQAAEDELFITSCSSQTLIKGEKWNKKNKEQSQTSLKIDRLSQALVFHTTVII